MKNQEPGSRRQGADQHSDEAAGEGGQEERILSCAAARRRLVNLIGDICLL